MSVSPSGFGMGETGAGPTHPSICCGIASATVTGTGIWSGPSPSIICRNRVNASAADKTVRGDADSVDGRIGRGKGEDGGIGSGVGRIVSASARTRIVGAKPADQPGDGLAESDMMGRPWRGKATGRPGTSGGSSVTCSACGSEGIGGATGGLFSLRSSGAGARTSRPVGTGAAEGGLCIQASASSTCNPQEGTSGITSGSLSIIAAEMFAAGRGCLMGGGAESGSWDDTGPSSRERSTRPCDASAGAAAGMGVSGMGIGTGSASRAVSGAALGTEGAELIARSR